METYNPCNWISFVTQKIEEVTKKLWFEKLGKLKAAELFFVFLF